MLEAILDSNIIIDHVMGRDQIEINLAKVGFSALTLFEIFRFPGMSPQEEQSFQDVVALPRVIPVNEAIAKRAADLARIRPHVRPLDVLIAATAIEQGLPLITKNVKDFKNIPDLIVRTKI